ncbi:unnamed protein product, partial [Ilex paraguariensis]
GKGIEVTPVVIAEALQYQRPPADIVVYPYGTKRRKQLHEYAHLVYKDPMKFSENIQVKELKNSYGVMHKILHYNVLPWGAEKKHGEEKMALLYEFM